MERRFEQASVNETQRHGARRITPPGIASAARGPQDVTAALPRALPVHDSRPRAPRTAFVLSGGASLGAMQAGMLRALYEDGITADLLVGTSAGALNAAFIAARSQTPRAAGDLADVWRGLCRDDVFPIHMPTLFGGLANRADHMVPDTQLRRLVARHLQISRLEDTCVPVHLVTFDLLSGCEVVLCNGPAHDAVVAAAAIPGVLPPVPWGEHLLVDGGVVNNTPISHAVELGAERIFVLPTVDPGQRALVARPRGARDAALHAFTLLAGARLQADLHRYQAKAELIVLPVANRLRVLMTDFDQAESLIAGALHASRRHLSGLSAREELAA
jgi:NTE family protein